MTIPAEWLPNAAVPVTIVCTHPEYGDAIFHMKVARDWRSRGEDYLRQGAALEPLTVIIAAFDGHHRSEIGSGIYL